MRQIEDVPADVRATYLAAWHAGVKGITVYPYGAPPGQVLTFTGPQAASRAAVRVYASYTGGCHGHTCEF